jgi:hypothetical protein
MASAVHAIDPNTDTAIILRSPGDGKHFACCDDSAFDNLDMFDQLPFTMLEQDTQVSDSNNTDDDQMHFETTATKKPDDTIPIIPEGSVLYYVSSRHLIFASPVFKAALSSNTWCDGRKKIDGHYYITWSSSVAPK